MSDDVLVLWDIDGTLLNSGGVGRDLYEEVFLQLFGRSLAACAPMAGRTDRAIILETLTLAGVDEPRRYVDPFIAGLGARAQAVHEAVAARGQALPGAAEVLAALAVARSLGSFAAFGSAFSGTVDKPGVMDKAVPMDKAGAVGAGAVGPGAVGAGAVGAGAVGAGAVGAGAVGAAGAQLAAAQAAVALAGVAHTAVTPAAAAQMAAAQVAVAAATGSVTGSAAGPATAVAGPAVAVQTAAAVQATTGMQATAAVQATAAAQAAVAVQLIPSQAAAAQPATSHMTVVPRAGTGAGAGAGPASGGSGLPAGGARSSRRVYQSVLTGNIRPLAEVKLSALSLRDGIDLCIGAYGDDHEDRTELVHVARRRAAGVVGQSPSSFSGTSTVVIGDTPLDVSAAVAAGARAVGVATGSYSAADLLEAGAHAVLPDLTDTSAVLRALLG